MKKLLYITSIFFLFNTSIVIAQLKIGYVDSDTIMDNAPDVQDARQKLDAFIREWQTELKKLETDYKAKKDDLEKRSLIMTDQTRIEAEKELAELDKGISDFRDKKFGPKGELFQKQDELMKPLQNKIFNIIQELAEEEELDFIFDRSGDIMLLYAKPDYDLTAQVIERLQLE
jgi:outer membrane protein